MARKFTRHSKKFYINISLFVMMCIISDEIFSSICLMIFFGEFVFWLLKNLPKDY